MSERLVVLRCAGDALRSLDGTLVTVRETSTRIIGHSWHAVPTGRREGEREVWEIQPKVRLE